MLPTQRRLGFCRRGLARRSRAEPFAALSAGRRSRSVVRSVGPARRRLDVVDTFRDGSRSSSRTPALDQASEIGERALHETVDVSSGDAESRGELGRRRSVEEPRLDELRDTGSERGECVLHTRKELLCRQGHRRVDGRISGKRVGRQVVERDGANRGATTLVLPCSRAPVLRCSRAPVLRCSGAPVLPCSGAPVLRCSRAPVLPGRDRSSTSSPIVRGSRDDAPELPVRLASAPSTDGSMSAAAKPRPGATTHRSHPRSCRGTRVGSATRRVESPGKCRRHRVKARAPIVERGSRRGGRSAGCSARPPRRAPNRRSSLDSRGRPSKVRGSDRNRGPSRRGGSPSLSRPRRAGDAVARDPIVPRSAIGARAPTIATNGDLRSAIRTSRPALRDPRILARRRTLRKTRERPWRKKNELSWSERSGTGALRE